MKSFFSRIFSMHPLQMIIGVCCIALTVCLCLCLLSVRATVVCFPKQIAVLGSALLGEVSAARVGLVAAPDRLADKIVPPVMAQVSRFVDGDPHGKTELERAPARSVISAMIAGQASGLRSDLFAQGGPVDRGLSLIDQARQDVDAQLGTFNATVANTAKPIGALASTYAALPAQLGEQLQPSWLAIEPEITCRQADGSGYGGCWHSRVTALMGEAARVGGVFTQRFPQFSDSINGMAFDFHDATHSLDLRFFHPAPRTKKQKVGDFLKGFGESAVLAGMRGGVL